MRNNIHYFTMLVLVLGIISAGSVCPAFAGGEEEGATQEKVIRALSVAIAKEPADPELYNERAYAYVVTGKYDNAVTDYTTALKIDPANAETYFNRGLLYEMHMGEFDRAIKDFEQALGIDKEMVDAYLEMAQCYAQKQQRANAIENYKEYIEAVPGNPEAYYGRAVAYFYHGQYGLAWDDVHKTEKLGGKVYDSFLKKLRTASGREK
jgi:tetratricopeptide (TPR) repeat protein